MRALLPDVATAPSPLFRVLNQFGADGIAFHITEHGE